MATNSYVEQANMDSTDGVTNNEVDLTKRHSTDVVTKNNTTKQRKLMS